MREVLQTRNRAFGPNGVPTTSRQTSATRTDTTSRLPISLGSSNKRYEPSTHLRPAAKESKEYVITTPRCSEGSNASKLHCDNHCFTTPKRSFRSSLLQSAKIREQIPQPAPHLPRAVRQQISHLFPSASSKNTA